jgi:hypothetical protein
LVSNTRAVVQLGTTDALMRTILARDFITSAVEPHPLSDQIPDDGTQAESGE